MSDHNHTPPGVAETEALLRELTAPDRELQDPPAALWDRIAEEALSAPAGGAAADTVVSLESRRRFARSSTLLAAAAAIVVLVVGYAVFSGDDPERSIVAVADLAFDADAFDPLGAGTSATVALVDEGGDLNIAFDAAVLPDPAEPADLEIWLIQPDADGNVAELVSLGKVNPDDPGDFTVPAEYDPDEFFVVDISIEPRDGDDAHSGRSILRGPLTRV